MFTTLLQQMLSERLLLFVIDGQISNNLLLKNFCENFVDLVVLF